MRPTTTTRTRRKATWLSFFLVVTVFAGGLVVCVEGVEGVNAQSSDSTTSTTAKSDSNTNVVKSTKSNGININSGAVLADGFVLGGNGQDGVDVDDASILDADWEKVEKNDEYEDAIDELKETSETQETSKSNTDSNPNTSPNSASQSQSEPPLQPLYNQTTESYFALHQALSTIYQLAESAGIPYHVPLNDKTHNGDESMSLFMRWYYNHYSRQSQSQQQQKNGNGKELQKDKDKDKEDKSSSKKSLLETFLPNTHGPIASTLRIVNKLRQRIDNFNLNYFDFDNNDNNNINNNNNNGLIKIVFRYIMKMLGFGSRGKGNGDSRGEKESGTPGGGGGGGGGGGDLTYIRSVKVLDILSYAIELGNEDALFVLGYVSLFAPTPYLYNLTRSYNSFLAHIDRSSIINDNNGNNYHDGRLRRKSRAYVAFLSGNAQVLNSLLGMSSTSPLRIGNDGSEEKDTIYNPPLSLLHYTFAGVDGDLALNPDSNYDGEENIEEKQEIEMKNGDKFSQMVLGYRYFRGIGVSEDCTASLEWYKRAAEESMTQYLHGPPGGLTLPLPVPKLSDLAGGVYGLGASAASTGANAYRAVVKAAGSRVALSRFGAGAGAGTGLGKKGLRGGVGVGGGEEGWEDVLEYYMFNAERGEIDYTFRLGKIFYQNSIYSLPGGIASGGDGVGALNVNFPKGENFRIAHEYFLNVARKVWTKDDPSSNLGGLKSQKTTGKEKENIPENVLSYASASASYLGRMYLRGEGVRRNYALARMWFERGAEFGERECHNALGVMWRDGLIPKMGGGSERDDKKAIAHFVVAANQELPEAQVNLGKIHYLRGELKVAQTHFENAIRHGSPFEPYYYLGEMYAAQAQAQMSISSHRSNNNNNMCSMAVQFYKHVAETGSWGTDNIVEDASFLWNWSGGAKEEVADSASAVGAAEIARNHALILWLLASERGVESAQNNLAFVLDQDKTLLNHIPSSISSLLPSLTSTSISSSKPQNTTAHIALTQWTRSAAQHNVDALVKVGDYHYYGIGLPEVNETLRWEKAAVYYQAAADTHLSAIAEWNLGWMYENGIGVTQDFHLAKRHYDSALETNSEAYLAVTLSLAKLYIRSLWHTIRGGEGGLPIWSDDSTKSRPKPPRELESSYDSQNDDFEKGKGVNDYADENIGNENADEGKNLGISMDAGADGYDDNEWYMGRAREEHERRMRMRMRALEGEEDPVQWAREHRAAAENNDDEYYDPGPEDFFEGALRGQRRRTGGNTAPGVEEGGEVNDEFAETMLLVLLCLAVSVLIWVRRRWVEGRLNEDENNANGAVGR